MRFYSPPCHFQLAGDFGVITALQQQFYDLPFARPKPNGLIIHPNTL
jgi:hypothetical protein